MRAAAANAAAGVPGEAVTNAAGGRFRVGIGLARVALLEVFARRGDAAALPTVIKAFNDPIKEVRVAAFATAAAARRRAGRYTAPHCLHARRRGRVAGRAARTHSGRGSDRQDHHADVEPAAAYGTSSACWPRGRSPSTLGPIFNAAKDADAGVHAGGDPGGTAELADDASVPALARPVAGPRRTMNAPRPARPSPRCVHEPRILRAAGPGGGRAQGRAGAGEGYALLPAAGRGWQGGS